MRLDSGGVTGVRWFMGCKKGVQLRREIEDLNLSLLDLRIKDLTS